ncbi:MAG: nucleotidyltransferase domain-containing protein [Blastocatellia bacterium]
MNDRLNTILNEFRQALAAIYGERLDRVILFGSQARGDALEGSDIDLLVVLSGDVYPGKEILRTGGIVSQISLKYDVVLSCLFFPAERFRREQSPLLRNVRREGVTV